MQSRLESFIEACFNTAIGFWINYTANMLILPCFGFKTLTLGQNFLIGVLYTLISVARQYTIRRWFNGKLKDWAARLATNIRG